MNSSLGKQYSKTGKREKLKKVKSYFSNMDREGADIFVWLAA